MRVVKGLPEVTLPITEPSITSDRVARGTYVVTLDGEFDFHLMPELADELSEILARFDSDIVVDLRGVTFLDSKFLRAFFLSLRGGIVRQREITVVRPNPHVWRAFELCGLDRMFPSVSCLQEAIGGGVNGPLPARGDA
jgi:anti-anti-sigma factor